MRFRIDCFLGRGRKGTDCLEQPDETFPRAKCYVYLSACHHRQLGSWMEWGPSFLKISGDGIMSTRTYMISILDIAVTDRLWRQVEISVSM